MQRHSVLLRLEDNMNTLMYWLSLLCIVVGIVYMSLVIIMVFSVVMDKVKHCKEFVRPNKRMMIDYCTEKEEADLIAQGWIKD